MGGRRGGTCLVLGVVAALAFAAPASAVIPAGNLVENPGAELGPEVPIQSWPTVTPLQNAASDYVQPDEPGLFLSVDDPGTDGCRGFFGDTSSETRIARQIIDVTEAAAEIDAGEVDARWGASLGRVAGDDDYATADLAFRNDQGGTIGITGVSGDGPPPLISALTPVDAGAIPVPVGTRSIALTISTVRVEGPNNAYVDTVGLSLDGSDPTPNAPIECSRPERSLSIGYSGRSESFKGRIGSPDARCRRGKVDVFKDKPGFNDRKVASDTANASGKWVAKERGARGKYYAKSAETRGNGLACARLTSKRKRV
jgi:hypothetical protein